MSAPKFATFCVGAVTVGLGGAAVAMPAAGVDSARLGAAAVTAGDGSPNVVLIVADDLGYDQTALYGRPGAIPVPNISALGNDGVRLTQGYVASPVCSPSRSALMTGREPARVGGDSNWLTRSRKERMPRDTIVRALPDTYQSIAIGKWDLAGNMPFRKDHLPAAMGFDDFYGFQGGAHSYCVPEPGKTNLVQYDAAADSYRPVAATHYLTREFTNRAVDYINQKAPTSDTNPFFMYLAYNAPHDPLDTPTTCAGHPEPNAERFRDMVRIMDNGVGQVRQALKSNGIADNTIVIFMSDNGQQYYYWTGPTRGGKYTLFEGGVKVPMAISWPGVLPADRRYDKPVSSLDFYPTLLAATQSTVSPSPEKTGVDLLPYLTGRDDSVPNPVLSWRYVVDRAVDNPRVPGAVQGTVIEAQRSGDYKWIHSTQPADNASGVPVSRNYLFDVAANPHEDDSGNLWGTGDIAPGLIAAYQGWNGLNPTTDSFKNARASDDVRAGLPDGYIESGGTWTTIPAGTDDTSYEGRVDAGASRSMLELSWYDDATTNSTLRLTTPGRAGVIVRGTGAADAFDGYVAGIAIPQDGSACAGSAPQPGGGSPRVYLAKVTDGEEKVVACADASIALNTDHQVEVTASANNFTVGLDGTRELTWTDTETNYRAGGRIGLEVATTSSGPTIADFATLNSHS